MFYYHMTSLNNLRSISVQGLLPKNGNNGKLIGEEKTKVFFSEGFEGAIALFVDFDIVFDKLKNHQIEVPDKDINEQLLHSESICDYLGEGVYLRFDGSEIQNERNFENGCTGMTISPGELSVCVLYKKTSNLQIFSRFELIKYMMSKTQPEQIHYYGVDYHGSPDFEEATARIQEKVRKYYNKHQDEISFYDNDDYTFHTVPLTDFIDHIC